MHVKINFPYYLSSFLPTISIGVLYERLLWYHNVVGLSIFSLIADILLIYLSQVFLFDLYIFYIDAVVGKHTVKYKGDEVHNLNELEYVAGEVWANVWQVC